MVKLINTNNQSHVLGTREGLKPAFQARLVGHDSQINNPMHEHYAFASSNKSFFSNYPGLSDSNFSVSAIINDHSPFPSPFDLLVTNNFGFFFFKLSESIFIPVQRRRNQCIICLKQM